MGHRQADSAGGIMSNEEMAQCDCMGCPEHPNDDICGRSASERVAGRDLCDECAPGVRRGEARE